MAARPDRPYNPLRRRLDSGTWLPAGAGAIIITMIDVTSSRTGRSLGDPTAVVRAGRRLVGLERHYSCRSCGSERSSWSRISTCPDCGEAFAAAVIRRAALA